MTKKEYSAKIAALEPLTDEQRKSITCALLGHSHIHTGFLVMYIALDAESK